MRSCRTMFASTPRCDRRRSPSWFIARTMSRRSALLLVVVLVAACATVRRRRRRGSAAAAHRRAAAAAGQSDRLPASLPAGLRRRLRERDRRRAQGRRALSRRRQLPHRLAGRARAVPQGSSERTFRASSPSRSGWTLRGAGTHVLTWGDPRAPKLFLLHGWMDVAASFQFLVDALHARALRDRAGPARLRPQRLAGAGLLVRGLRRRPRCAARATTRPTSACDWRGHSLGANVVMHYAGVRPQRVRGADRARRLRHSRAKRRSARRTSSPRGSIRSRDAAVVRAVCELRRRRAASAQERPSPHAGQGGVPRAALGRARQRMAACASRRIRATSDRFRSSIVSRKCSRCGAGSRRGRCGSRPRIRTSRPGSIAIRKARRGTDSLAGVRKRMTNIRGATLAPSRRRATCSTTTSRRRWRGDRGLHRDPRTLSEGMRAVAHHRDAPRSVCRRWSCSR